MGRFHTDDPDADYLRWEAYQVQKQERYKSMLVRCDICHRAIDPDVNEFCLHPGDDVYIHAKCFDREIEQSSLPYFLKDYIYDLVIGDCYTSTPVPEV